MSGGTLATSVKVFTILEDGEEKEGEKEDEDEVFPRFLDKGVPLDVTFGIVVSYTEDSLLRFHLLRLLVHKYTHLIHGTTYVTLFYTLQ